MALQSRGLFHAVVFLVQLVTMTTTSQFYCHGTCYKGAFNPTLDVQKNSALVGHSYRNISGKTDAECLRTCINDCKCLSFQTQTSRCELLDEDRVTAGNDFQAISGYNYYDIQQEFVQQNINNCLNGCCRSNPCLNGGTCTELCSDVKIKFSCACPVEFNGKLCEINDPPSASCPDIKAKQPLAASGVYTLHDSSSGSSLKTYCDFNSEPNFVWTLIESFAFSNKNDFAWSPFKNDEPRDEAIPNWNSFRLAKASMFYIQNQSSTHFRATCNFEKDNFDINADYLRGKTSSLDILSGTVNDGACIGYERIKVVGVGCDNCTAVTYNGGGYHTHLEDDSCDLVGAFGGYVSPHREYFGYYNKLNNQHKCVNVPESTTQWWLGVEV